MTEKDSPRGGKARTWNGRYVNIAHRRTPSELTPLIQQNMPLIQQNLALQQQVEMLTVQNQHMLAQMGGVPPQGGVPGVQGVPGGVFVSSPMLPPPQLYAPSHHHRGESHGSHSSLGSAQQFGLGPPNSPGHMRQRSMGHQRRHSLAVSEARRAAQERSSAAGSISSSAGLAAPSSSAPSQSGGLPFSPATAPLDAVPQFRFPPSPERASRPTERGHSRSPSMSSMHRQTPSPQRFTFPPPQDEHREFYGHRPRASNASIDFSPNAGGNSGGRKSLFVPYLTRDAIPKLLQDGLLVTGTLRVNHKNRSDAYVTTDLLDADVFIAGSKDRNRALEGDLVAVELLDVEEVWDQKREKEEKKRRRGAQEPAAERLVETQEGQLRRRGSLRQRAPQKRSDDVEVEGQTLLLREELGSGDAKPLYAGHVVAILERPAGQLFSGTLGLLRPSSQATKERQQHSRQASGQHDPAPHHAPPHHADRPKIVWFKPTEKCVPLMAIPTEQAPADLVENPGAYADQIFVAQIKRWPITSLHPFGMLVEKLGQYADPEVARTAVLRDFNFGPHRFSDGAAAEAQDAAKTMADAAHTLPAAQATFVSSDTALSLRDVDGEEAVAVHILDVTPFVRHGGLLDRELRHKSAGVYMDGFESPLLAPEVEALIAFKEGRASPALTVEIALGSGVVRIKREAVTPVAESLLKFTAAASVLRDRRGLGALGESALELDALLDVVVPVRAPLSTPTVSDLIELELTHAANAAIASELLRSPVGMSTLLRCQVEPPIGRLEEFAQLMRDSGLRIDTTSAQTLSHSLAEQLTPRQAAAVTAALAKILAPQRYVVGSRTPPGQMNHYWFGYPAYTHFARPLHRYADQVVARQVHNMLAAREGQPHPEDSGAAELAAELSFRYDCARNVQEQSFHLSLSRSLSPEYRLVSGIVVAVYESAFDVVVPELSVEKRVHGDQIPLSKAEFQAEKRVLELYWTPGADSAAYAADGEPEQDGQTPPIPPELRDKLVLRDDHVQEIRPLYEVPVLIRVDVGGRVLPSIVVLAANPFK